jgi:hypothetical protein
MTTNDQVLLDIVLKKKKADSYQATPDAEFFTLFTAEQVLKPWDVTFDQLDRGLVDGGGDGGIDAIYAFVNGELVEEDTTFEDFKEPITFDIYVLQSKQVDGFSEASVEKFISSARDLFDLTRDLISLSNVYNETLRRVAQRIREAVLALTPKFPTVSFHYAYSSKGADVHGNVHRKVEALEAQIKRHFPDARFDFEFLTARRLHQLASEKPKDTFQISLALTPIISGASGYIALVKLEDLYAFVNDEKGRRRASIFEANVREYQGSVKVNAAIRQTLEQPQLGEDFWWLNNGITILSAAANLTGLTLTLRDPQIVNGLQTSTEIHRFFKEKGAQQSGRCVLVRVIVTDREVTRDRVIKATNSQTNIPEASLRATDEIHREIEEFFQQSGLYYERRKNSYKNAGKPKDRIVTLPYLAQAIMALLLGEPDQARARPSTLLSDDNDYGRVFNRAYPLEMYLRCARIMKRVDEFLRSTGAVEAKDRTNLRFFVGMYAVRRAAHKAEVRSDDLSAFDVGNLSDEFLNGVLSAVDEEFSQYIKEDPTRGIRDRVAKSKSFRDRIQSRIRDEIADWWRARSKGEYGKAS